MVQTKVAAQTCHASDVHGSVFEGFPARETSLGTLKILRALPVRQKRLVGAWCFLDRFGPLSFNDAKPMDVAPHPHIGLQTVSWLLQGEIVHHDSLGSEALLRPGGVNVMTSGGGIAHAEETPAKNSGLLNGVQLWIALPEANRNGEASFQHINEVPTDARHPALRDRQEQFVTPEPRSWTQVAGEWRLRVELHALAREYISQRGVGVS